MAEHPSVPSETLTNAKHADEFKYAEDMLDLQHRLAAVESLILKFERRGAITEGPHSRMSADGTAGTNAVRVAATASHGSESHSADRALNVANFAITVVSVSATFAIAVVSAMAGWNYFSGRITEEKLQTELKKYGAEVSNTTTESKVATAETREARSNLESAVSAATAAHEALWLVDRGELELYVHKNVNRAQALVDRAERSLVSVSATTKEAESSKQLLNPIWSAVFLLQAHCALHQPHGLARVEANLERLRVMSPHDLRDVHLLDGIWQLHMASKESTDGPTRLRLLKEAQKKLEAAMADDRNGHKGLIYLSLAALDSRDFTLARESAEQFLAAFPSEPGRRERLGADTKALLLVATCWKEFGEFLEDPQPNHPFSALPCGTEALMSLSEPDGRLCLAMLDRIEAALITPELDSNVQELGRQYCQNVRGALNVSMGSCMPTVSAPAPPPEAPNPPVEPAPTPPTENAPKPAT